MNKKNTAFISSRSAAQDRLEEFSEVISDYATTRNHVVAGHPHVSSLSAALRARLISEYEVMETVLSGHAFQRVEKYIQEVSWRLYWKGWLEWHPEVWNDYSLELSACEDALSDEEREVKVAMETGKSGVPVMDRFAQELTETGYLHNHARMWFAAYWIHTRGLAWQLGADFFYRHLLDADPASNTLSWRWVAGMQTPGKKYIARAENIRKYCRYSETEDTNLDRHLAMAQCETDSNSLKSDPPQRISVWNTTSVPHLTQRYLLWIHGEDLSFWEAGHHLPDQPPVDTVMVTDPALMAKYRISSDRIELMQQSLSDASGRWQAFAGKAPQQLTGALVKTLVSVAREKKCEVVAGILPAVGPLRSLVPQLSDALAVYGVELILWRRREDEQVLPLAQRGFFPFWKEMSQQWR